MLAGEVRIVDAPVPGGVGRIVALHGAWYARHWGFGLPFESKVAAEAGAFAHHLPHADSRLFLAVSGQDCVLGGLALDGREAPAARIRWFILDEAARGGTGRRLLRAALDFARDRHFASVWLTTFAGLDAARRLYESQGFRLVEEAPENGWGVAVCGQRFEMALG